MEEPNPPLRLRGEFFRGTKYNNVHCNSDINSDAHQSEELNLSAVLSAFRSSGDHSITHCFTFRLEMVQKYTNYRLSTRLEVHIKKAIFKIGSMKTRNITFCNMCKVEPYFSV